jgi:hypothetical protein
MLKGKSQSDHRNGSVGVMDAVDVSAGTGNEITERGGRAEEAEGQKGGRAEGRKRRKGRRAEGRKRMFRLRTACVLYDLFFGMVAMNISYF